MYVQFAIKIRIHQLTKSFGKTRTLTRPIAGPWLICFLRAVAAHPFWQCVAYAGKQQLQSIHLWWTYSTYIGISRNVQRVQRQTFSYCSRTKFRRSPANCPHRFGLFTTQIRLRHVREHATSKVTTPCGLLCVFVCVCSNTAAQQITIFNKATISARAQTLAPHNS